MNQRPKNPDSTVVMPERFPGGHRSALEEGIFTLVTVGPFSQPDMQLFMDLGTQLSHRDGIVLLLLDATGGFAVDAAARKYYAKGAKEGGHIAGSTAVVGAGMAARAMLTLLINAAQIINRKPVPLRFFTTRTDALAWLALERVRWLQPG